jgi:hypothetical protein
MAFLYTLLRCLGICKGVYKGQRKSFSKDLILISPTGLWHCSDSLINNSSPEPFRKRPLGKLRFSSRFHPSLLKYLLTAEALKSP